MVFEEENIDILIKYTSFRKNSALVRSKKLYCTLLIKFLTFQIGGIIYLYSFNANWSFEYSFFKSNYAKTVYKF